MATSAPVPQQGGPSPQGGAILQIVALISRGADQLAKLFPAASPMADDIQTALREAQQKIAETQSPAQPQAPPI